ncbi:hypothetical protein EWM64_g9750 [Hericium alpestre]|uniref:Uncharacterized protein n=1 Tax=Hericium alpestre TaxID=135208 RepID=A0A4Y9ZHZ3_9AGAM|nr:hypothetical protein EWM64_g9750 [Hericium alpestre]
MTAKGKRRAEPLMPFAPKHTLATLNDGRGAETSATSLSSPSPEELAPPPAKRRKRADTRPCPVCSDPIPVRLLGAHAVLEFQRLQALIDAVGDEDVWVDPHSTEFDTSGGCAKRGSWKGWRTLTLGHVCGFRICWSSDVDSTMKTSLELHRGVWAGHRFDTVSEADWVPEEEPEGGNAAWRDVSEDALAEAEEIWEAAYY